MKKKKVDLEEKEWYCIAYFITDDIPEKLTDKIENYIFDNVDNVGVISEKFEDTLTEEEKKEIESCLPGTSFTYPSFAIMKINHDRVNEEIKNLEKKQKWKKFFNLIPDEDYDDAWDRGMFDYSKTLFFSTDPDKVIHFLNNQ